MFDKVDLGTIGGFSVSKVILGITLLVVGLIGNPLVCVGSGHRGVVTTCGSVSDRVLNEGMSVVVPFVQSVRQIEVRIQKTEVNSEAPSKDLQGIHTVITLNYHPSPGSVNRLYQEIGLDFNDTIVIPAVLETMKHVSGHFTASELVTDRDRVALEIRDSLTAKLAKFYLQVDEVSMKDFKFSQTFTDSIELKQKAEQDALRAKNELERVKVEAEQKVAEARADAEALRLKSQQLTPLMVEMERIKKWDGKYPDTYLGSGSNTLFQLK